MPIFVPIITYDMVVQKLRKKEGDEFQVAERYYAVLSSLNSLSMTPREIQLVAHTSIRGNISYAQFKEEFCAKHETSIQTINNMISRLKRSKVFVKENGKIRVNPLLSIKFNDGIKLEIWISQ